MSRAPGDRVANLVIDTTAFVAPGAVVVGEVTLGKRSSIWFNTVVRGDSASISIGDDTNVQDNSVVHVDEGQPAVIGARVTVGHRAIVHGCVVEDDCLIGMGAVLLSGARVGAGSLVGAAALVREGQEIPPGSVALGVPARVTGEVSEAHREAIHRGAQHYVELSRSYLARGFARPHPWPDSDTGTAMAWVGPMTFEEWGRLLGALAEGPDWVARRLAQHPKARWRARPGPDRWSALEVLCHLRDADREVFGQRIERRLTETVPVFPDPDLSGRASAGAYRDSVAAVVLAEWRDIRRALVARLAPLGRVEWARLGVHSLRGHDPLGDMVRSWVEHDLSHRRQMDAALTVAG